MFLSYHWTPNRNISYLHLRSIISVVPANCSTKRLYDLRGGVDKGHKGVGRSWYSAVYRYITAKWCHIKSWNLVYERIINSVLSIFGIVIGWIFLQNLKHTFATFQADILSHLRPNENAIPSLKSKLFLQNREEEIFPGHNDAGVLHTALLQSPSST